MRRRADDIFSARIDGTLTIVIGGCYTLDNVEEAHAALEQRRMIGKPLLTLPP